MRHQEVIRRLRVWIALAFTVTCGADFLTSGSTYALAGAVAGAVGTILILMNPLAETEDEYRQWRVHGWGVLAASAVVFALLVALGAPREAFLAFGGGLMLIAAISVVWAHMDHVRK